MTSTTSHISPSTLRRHHALRTLAAAGDRDANAAKDALARIEQRYPSLATAKAPSLADAKNWRHAAKMMIQHYTRHDLCFTAGEIARAIRLARPDLQFKCTNLFRFIAGASIEYVAADGWREEAAQVERTTSGTTRSPAGSTYIVYAPSTNLGLLHDGEVEIPRPTPLALSAST